jgi:hypothetical protein
VLSHLQGIGSGKSSGPDNLPNWVLKSFADLLAEPVTVILESLSFALYGKRQTPGKEKFYGIRQ